MRSPLRPPLLASLLLALAACGGRAPAPIDAPAAAAPPAAADFSVYDLEARWMDQGGRDRALRSLGGRVQVVAMVYTHCTHTCPAIVAEMQAHAAKERPLSGVSLPASRTHKSECPKRDGNSLLGPIV